MKPAAHDVWSIVTGTLADSGHTIIIIGLVAVLGAWLAGTGRWAMGLRRWLAPSFRERAALVYGGFAVLYLLLILWAPTGAFRRPLSLAVIFGLALVGIEALRRQTRREFPDAQSASPRLAERWADWRGSGRAPAEPASTPAVDAETARLQRLERLAALRDSGVLTEEEFAAEKTWVLGHRPA